jgi:hypothetical protein
MANFTPSNLLAAQVLLADKYKAPEMRMKVTPVLNLGLQNQNILIPSAQTIKTRDDRAVYAFLLNRTSRAATSTRAAAHTGNRGDSTSQTLTWATYADKFSISVKQLDNNIFDFNQTFAQQIENAMKNIIVSAESYAVGLLQTNRTVINAATAGGSFNATNYAFEIAGGTQFYQKVKSMMRQNKYNDGQFDVITNSDAFINAEYQASQGAGNNANTQFQFNGLNIAESIELTDSNYPSTSVALCMPKGAFAALPWIPKQNREGRGSYDSYLGGYGSMADPFGLGITFAVHGYSARTDTSASNGNVQDDLMEFELSVDLAFPTSPLSTATESVIFEAVAV